MHEGLRATTNSPPVGAEPPDLAVTIRDEKGNALPDGEVGEIVIASRYIGLGYWGGRDFAVDPTDSTIRTFPTGDYGRRRADGLIEFVGRRDQQIKLRGHRIEPSEVEAELRLCSGVKDASIVVRQDHAGNPMLVAYVEPQPGIDGLLPRHLSSMLRQRLPDYMLPASIFVVPDLPRLANFKIDRVRLAALDAAQAAKSSENGDARTVAVIEIFKTITDAAVVTGDDNLISIGGDSLQALDIAFELERRFKVEVSPETFDPTRTMNEWAQWLASRSRDATIAD
jgi:acyl-coenzyme A synthetase/AMP-(fatty) acid ligase/acyl carrier protein